MDHTPFYICLILCSISICVSHASVKQFIEVNIAFFTPYSHLNHDFFHLTVRSIIWHTNRWWQCSEEIKKSSFSQFYTAILLTSESNPNFHKDFRVYLEFLDWIIVRHIILFKLLKNDQYEQIQHYLLNENYKHNPVKWSIRRATIFIFQTVWRSVGAVLHHIRPVFTSCENVQENK